MQKTIKKDEIDLRELFSTIGQYKWSIIFFTLVITIIIGGKIYFMPKYYKSTVILEVKSHDTQAGGFSMGGAAAMLLGGGTGSTNLEKDIALMKTYRTTKQVLDKRNEYMIRYFVTNEKHQEIELEKDISIRVTDVKINDYKKYGMRLIIKPLNRTQYTLLTPTRFSSKELGIFHYSEIVHYIDHKTKRETFSFMIHKKENFTKPIIIELAGTKRFIYNNIINKNLMIEADKKSPFLIVSYMDTLPHRGETYLKNLIEIYTKQSIQDVKEDSSIIMNSYDQQIAKIEKRVQKSAKKLSNYKSKHGIIQPSLQATTLVKELSKVDIEIAQNNYKQDLVKHLILFAKRHENIDAIAPSLVDLEDKPTINLIGIIQNQQLKLSELLIRYKSNHPQVITAQQIIDNLKYKILSNLQNLKHTLHDKQRSLNKMKQSYKKKFKSVPKQEQKIITFTRNYKINEKLYLYLMQERSVAQLKHDKALGRFKIIEDIYTPKQASKPKKALMIIVTFITSLIFMIFITFFRKFLKKGRNKNE